MKNKKILLTSTLMLIICIVCILNVFAHKGRTDANGGHRDNNNQSGLGSYHFHCGGYPAHLHNNGVCPYKTTSSSKSSYSANENLIDYEDSYDYGYDNGYEDGHSEGHNEGYNEGYDDGYDKGYDEGYKARIEDAAAEREKEYNFLLVSTFVIVAIVLLVRFIKRRRKE